jgi:hypothetical protein
MQRDELAHLLDGGGNASQACRTALLGGADLTLWDDAAPAARMVPAYERRHAQTISAGAETLGFPEALTALRDAGARPVRLGRVTSADTPYVFMIFLAAEPASVVACFGAER